MASEKEDPFQAEDPIDADSGGIFPEVLFIEQSSSAEVDIPGEEDSLPDFSPSTPDPADEYARMSKETEGRKRPSAAAQTKSSCCLLL
jgi:hypothetical protein